MDTHTTRRTHNKVLLGADYFLHREPERERRRAITALNKLGYTVTLNPIELTTNAA